MKESDAVEAERLGMCHVCGKPGIMHLTDINDGKQTSRSFCPEHAPEMRAILRKQIEVIDQQVVDPTKRAEFKAEIEKLIANIEAGRRRMGDAD